MRHLIVSAVLLAAALGLHSSSGELTGLWFVGADLVGDAAESDSTHFFLWLDGASAESLYHLLDADPAADDCTGDGSMIKAAPPIQCKSAPGGAYECYIGIDTRGPSLAPGVIC